MYDESHPTIEQVIDLMTICFNNDIVQTGLINNRYHQYDELFKMDIIHTYYILFSICLQELAFGHNSSYNKGNGRELIFYILIILS